MSPDLICQVLLESGKPITNTELQKGQSVALIGLQARAIHRKPEFIDLLAPKHYGFELDYIPIEKQMGSKKR